MDSFINNKNEFKQKRTHSFSEPLQETESTNLSPMKIPKTSEFLDMYNNNQNINSPMVHKTERNNSSSMKISTSTDILNIPDIIYPIIYPKNIEIYNFYFPKDKNIDNSPNNNFYISQKDENEGINVSSLKKITALHTSYYYCRYLKHPKWDINNK